MSTPTCCQYHGLDDCRQGRDCPARKAADDAAHVRYQPTTQPPVVLSRDAVAAMDETMEANHETH